jgi:hypothetical protein
MDVPAPGLYGLFAGAHTRGVWAFDIPGLTFNELINTTFYFASLWDVDAPPDIHPDLSAGGTHAIASVLHGSATGSFKLERAFFETGNPWFGLNVFFGASTFAQDTNQPGTMDFSYRIAFSTTPIDASVFDPPAATDVPEPGSLLLMGGPVAGFIARRRRSAARRAADGPVQ